MLLEGWGRLAGRGAVSASHERRHYPRVETPRVGGGGRWADAGRYHRVALSHGQGVLVRLSGDPLLWLLPGPSISGC